MIKTDIDEVMRLFDWNNSEKEQQEGLELAKNIKNLNAFMQPLGKNVWENCAKTIYSRTDEDLIPYLFNILEWLQDMNWPGTIIIANRLKKFKNRSLLEKYIMKSIEKAKLLKDENWELYLNTFENYCDYK